ncbi:serine--tRNA ligase [Caldisericum exile]|uniref:Serine--tRNA ligase n=1 Tax=Caldisericum exile (strain DSM 21853 / NBRC 104410 / AZM16c01) TaxID=511051 RepID=A0A7U6JH17_CALEA|nr:serine--tRNA ligase [Caldisericum exile]BAL81202.1 seryl-tRNA synthetase [Caldisericum exile AZM16c01]
MLDPNLIREKPEIVKEGIKNKGGDPTLVDKFLEVDKKRRELVKDIDNLRHTRKELSESIGRKLKQGEQVDGVRAEVRKLGEEINQKEKELENVEKIYKEILLSIPNLPHPSVPVGKDETENVVLRKEGKIREFNFPPKPHWEIAEALGLIDFKRAVKISGSRFYVLTGLGAKLERALISFMIDYHIEHHGYKEIFPPFLINRDSMIGTGQLPKFAEDMYKIEGEELYLDPTAEVPVTNLHRDEILNESDLPIKYVAYTACFRKEAGAAGKDTRGIIRVHQFNKVEMVRFTKPEESYKNLYELLDNAEDILRALELPYQIKMMCTGDLGFTAAMKFDPEVYMPAQEKYVEISSVSNFEDFQARRANIKYRTNDGELKFVHTLNGSGLAVGRTMAAILENYQNEDGSVSIPKVLQKYMGIDKITRK